MTCVRAALVFLAVVACSDRKAAPPPASLTKPSSPQIATMTDKAKHVVTAVVDDWNATSATMRLWERSNRGWTPLGSSWPAVVGRTGTAWGIGVHGETPPREGPIKKEGDGKSPAGVFAIRNVYGVADKPPRGTKLAYETTAEGDWQCVDDPNSEHYDQIIDRKQVAADWDSAEELLRDDALYTWVVDVAHNPERKKAKGSCIFLHVWGGANAPTAGCTAMAEDRLTMLIGSLDPSALYVLLPKADYAVLTANWGLPPQ